MDNGSSSPNYETTLLWFIKVLAGGLILVFLVIHFIINHLVAPGGLLTFKDVVMYYQNPLVLIMEGCFLTFVLVHSFIGLRSILLDLRPSRKIIRMMDIVLPIVGIGVFAYGLWLLITVSRMPVLP